MRYAWLGKMLPLLLPLVFVMAPHEARAVAVDVELILLIDVSGSINDETEYPLQMQGYMDAFNDPRVLSAIQGGELGRIAVRADFWSSADQYETAVDWTLISDASSAGAFASETARFSLEVCAEATPGAKQWIVPWSVPTKSRPSLTASEYALPWMSPVQSSFPSAAA